MIKKADYTKVALIYDRFLDHIDYPMWADYIRDITQRHHLSFSSILDLACGTGSFLNEFKNVTLRKTGLELSEEMLQEAKKKYPDSDCDYIHADMLNFRSEQKFDLISCLFDSMNYLDSLEKISTCINSAYENLTDSGLFIFDAVSQKSCKEYFYDYTEKDEIDGIYYERHCRYILESNIQESHFIFEIEGEQFEELHRQHIFTFDEIKAAIEKSKMQLLGAYSDFGFEKLDRYSERAHFVLGKQS